MDQIFKDFLRKRHYGTAPAFPDQVEKYVDAEEFYTAVLNDKNHIWTKYDGDSPKSSPCVHFTQKASEVVWSYSPQGGED